MFPSPELLIGPWFVKNINDSSIVNNKDSVFLLTVFYILVIFSTLLLAK